MLIGSAVVAVWKVVRVLFSFVLWFVLDLRGFFRGDGLCKTFVARGLFFLWAGVLGGHFRVTEFCWVVDAKLQEWRWLGAWLLFPVCSSLTVLKGFEFRGGI